MGNYSRGDGIDFIPHSLEITSLKTVKIISIHLFMENGVCYEFKFEEMQELLLLFFIYI
jgi:hypothetical protein